MRPFRTSYSRSLFAAAIAFGLVHGGQMFAVSLIKNSRGSVDPTSFITLGVLELLQSSVFAAIGGVLAFYPSKFLASIRNNESPAGLLNLLSGLLIGVVFLPLCAGLAYSLFHESDSPSFLARCAEFIWPMTISGVVGGYVFSRCATAERGNTA
jgi:hypothetical protein